MVAHQTLDLDLASTRHLFIDESTENVIHHRGREGTEKASK